MIAEKEIKVEIPDEPNNGKIEKVSPGYIKAEVLEDDLQERPISEMYLPNMQCRKHDKYLPKSTFSSKDIPSNREFDFNKALNEEEPTCSRNLNEKPKIMSRPKILKKRTIHTPIDIQNEPQQISKRKTAYSTNNLISNPFPQKLPHVDEVLYSEFLDQINQLQDELNSNKKLIQKLTVDKLILEEENINMRNILSKKSTVSVGTNTSTKNTVRNFLEPSKKNKRLATSRKQIPRIGPSIYHQNIPLDAEKLNEAIEDIELEMEERDINLSTLEMLFTKKS